MVLRMMHRNTPKGPTQTFSIWMAALRIQKYRKKQGWSQWPLLQDYYLPMFVVSCIITMFVRPITNLIMLKSFVVFNVEG